MHAFICEASCAWQAPQLRMQVLLLGGQRDRESLLQGLSDQSKSALCILPNDKNGNIHQIAFQLNSAEDIRRGFFAEATRTPSRTYGGRTRLHNYDEQQIWIHEQDITQMYVNHHWPVDLWEHKNQAIRDSVGFEHATSANQTPTPTRTPT